MAMAVDVVRPARRSELDAIRAFVVMGLVFFHSALVFDARDDFYVKNPETTGAITIFAGLAVVWAMPMLFMVAGLGVWHSLRRRGPAGMAAERLRRLGVPLVFVTVALVPLPQWLRLRGETGSDESYPRFLPRFFDVHLDLSEFPFVLQGEHFETGHLWFVVLLLAFSLMLAPVAAWLPRDSGRQVLDRLATAARRRGAILLPAVPVAVLCALVGLEESYAGWSRWAYLLFFVYGVVLAADRRFREAMRRAAGLAGVLAIALFSVGAVAFMSADDPFTDMTGVAIAARTLYGLTGWCALVAIAGFLDRPTRSTSDTPGGGRLSGYVSTAALPLYLLHQPILVAVAYVVVRWDAGIPIKYAVLVTVTYAITVAAYELLVRRTRPTRFLFGLRA
ncbi:acyltransferase family protein [Phytohabitans sp. LJ34]|uniref:acyltransferase family protein n=1 Tax=Phytohabitans sp. LJ34 TaxID=3452217 RepID=UPI003F8AB64E